MLTTTGTPLQFDYVNHVMRRFLNSTAHLRPHHCSAQKGERKVRIDERLDSQTDVNVVIEAMVCCLCIRSLGLAIHSELLIHLHFELMHPCHPE